MIDYLHVIEKYLSTYNKTFVFIDYAPGYGGNTLSRIISVSPEFYWDGNPLYYPDDGYNSTESDPEDPHFATAVQMQFCCTHTIEDFMYPDPDPRRVKTFILKYNKFINQKKVCIKSHSSTTHELFPNNTVVRVYGKEPDFRFFDSTGMYKKPKQFPNVINVDVNEIFSKDYDTFETAYLDICTKLDITPQINRVRAFILLWLERQERYKKL